MSACFPSETITPECVRRRRGAVPHSPASPPSLDASAGSPLRSHLDERTPPNARRHARRHPRSRSRCTGGRPPRRVRRGVRRAARARGVLPRADARGAAPRRRPDAGLGDAGRGARADALCPRQRAARSRRRARPRRAPRRGALMRLRHLAALSVAALASSPLPVATFAAGVALAEPAARYGLEPRATPSRLEARVLELARSRLRPPPRTSPALVLAARELAGRAAAGEEDPIGRGRLRGALSRALAYDPAPAAVLVVSATEDAAAAVARALPRTSATDVGAGTVERDGRAFVVLLLSERKARLDPFPREAAPGARGVLSGALAPPLSRPRVFVTRPSGEVVDAGGGAARAFRIPLDFPAPGRHVVEVVGEGDAGPEVAVGGAALDPPRPAATAPEPEDRAEAEAGVLRVLNATRRRHGLAPVSPSAELAAVARRHAEAMAAAGRVAHVVAGSGEAGGRLRRAGVPYRRAYENVARAGTALDAHQAAEESPAHLANVLRREASRAGIGIARARLPSGDRTVYLTEILVESPDDGADSRLTPDARVRERKS